ncbi:tRNA-splicing endonuclease subunit Sen34 isoform X2 [Eurytemora carolleeae]|uniref:tRNA-splicing endonuclease subunit Sen34 isoform X2 n=1 Tax=Eurytemora carolleeae TaxID=1294199 RepID=UPI000C76AF17|nr:tRNA-splicing endonuclease subunit Sen34 isoform X2 [Eurytemora carolleeae]|eukprot:XP_023331935.1 tRNA-splicing endonuclease subunit Sen34-like isoform X2 [Eurytemora affinis]
MNENSKIEVQIENCQGYVWSVQDVLRLRRDHRILGSLVGCGAKHPREEQGLPLLLSPQEIQVLKEENVVRLVQLPELREPPTAERKSSSHEYLESSYQQQIHIFKKEKEKNIEQFADRILAGKLKKMEKMEGKILKKNQAEAGLSPESKALRITREDVIAEEIKKIQPISRDHQVLQIHLRDPWISEQGRVKTRWVYPTGELNKCRLLAFKRLREQGLFVGEGSKFGGDFLVYLGDPVRFHAKYILICKEKNWIEGARNRPQDLVAKSNQVRKIILVATLQDEDTNETEQSEENVDQVRKTRKRETVLFTSIVRQVQDYTRRDTAEHFGEMEL